MQRHLGSLSNVRHACNKRRALDIDTAFPLNDFEAQERRLITLSNQDFRNLIDAVHAKVQCGKRLSA